MKIQVRNKILRLDHFELGSNYQIKFPAGNFVNVRFIKVTPCGYNFLNLETNKCLLKRHLYKDKWKSKNLCISLFQIILKSVNFMDSIEQIISRVAKTQTILLVPVTDINGMPKDKYLRLIEGGTLYNKIIEMNGNKIPNTLRIIE